MDYYIASIQAFKLIDYFAITGVDGLYSDGHSVICCNIKLNSGQRNMTNTNKQLPTQLPKHTKPQWQSSSEDTFLRNINTNIHEINNLLRIAESTPSQCKMDELSNKLSDIFTNSASQSFSVKRKYQPVNPKKSKWFGGECKASRKIYNKARKRAYKYPSNQNKIMLSTAAKHYKKIMNKYINKHNKEYEQKLRTLQSKFPKDYWKILKSIKNKHTVKPPDLQTLHNYFKDLNTNNTDDGDINISQVTDNIAQNENLNAPFTEDEIQKSIRNLKNNKSPGIDNVLNEYIKCTQTVLLPIYVKLFNLILSSGYIPKNWSEGIIIPIYKNKGDNKDPSNYRPITLLSCVGKLFTSVLNERLNKYLMENSILNENQAGFRHNYSTLDHLFTLSSIIEILRHNKKNLSAAILTSQKHLTQYGDMDYGKNC